MNNFTHVPPGFRFHPTDEELVDYYLRKKITSRRIDLDVIKDVDLYKIEPWDLQELCRIGSEEQNEWYFFSHKDKKYPTGTRTNRATAAGFWKATGRDKAIYSKHELIGMRKTLVFYKGRAPNGQKSDWIMHEYRLETDENGTPQEEGWVVCRVFKKRMTTMRRMSEHESPCWYDDQLSFMQQDLDSPKQPTPTPNLTTYHHHHLPSYICKKELDFSHTHNHNDQFLQLPLLESPNKILPTMLSSYTTLEPFNNHTIPSQDDLHFYNEQQLNTSSSTTTTDWRVFDKFVASQLSQDAAQNNTNNNNNNNNNASTSSSSCQIDLWK